MQNFQLPKIRENKQSIADLIVSSKEYIYPSLFYVGGLIIGSFLFSYSNVLSEMMKSIFQIQVSNFQNLLINRLCIYMSVYVITILFGLCLIGFPFINLIPLAVGVEIAMKISYYYVTYSVKGIGYAVLMIIPESAAFVTVLVYTIKQSCSLSKNIYLLTTNKTDMTEELNLKSYLKLFLFYAFIVSIIALINTAAIYLLGAIIKI